MGDTRGMHDGTDSPDDIAARLELLRQWTGKNQRAFAEASDVTPSEWSVYERGRRALPLNVALKLKRRWRVSLDWIYYGDRAGLSVEVDRTLPQLHHRAQRA